MVEAGLDGVRRSFVASGRDGAGLRSRPVTLTLRLDNVAPVIAEPVVEADRGVASGRVTDGGGLGTLTAILRGAGGVERREPIAVEGDGTWRLSLPPGDYALTLVAVDIVGNVSRSIPVPVRVAPWRLWLPRVERSSP
jgi:hypothetical protein